MFLHLSPNFTQSTHLGSNWSGQGDTTNCSRAVCFNFLQSQGPTRDCSPPGSSVCGISQARILEWVAISYSRRSSPPRDQTHISCISCIDRWILSILFSIVALSVYTPTNSAVGFSITHILSRINCLQFFIDSNSDWYEVISHCIFELHFTNNEQCWAYFYVFVDHL